MRTRIALVAIVSIALITVTLLSQLVSVQPARAANATPRTSSVRCLLYTSPSPRD